MLEADLQRQTNTMKARDAELAAARGQINALETALQAASRENARQAALHSALEAGFQKVVKARDAELAAARDQINALEKGFQEKLEATHKSYDEKIRDLQRKLAEPAFVESTKTHIIQQQMRTITRLNNEIIVLNHQAERLRNLLQSTSWRVTAPLRAAKIQWNRLRGIR
jgi:uncharacterized protein (DUF3084 family)